MIYLKSKEKREKSAEISSKCASPPPPFFFWALKNSQQAADSEDLQDDIFAMGEQKIKLLLSWLGCQRNLKMKTWIIMQLFKMIFTLENYNDRKYLK